MSMHGGPMSTLRSFTRDSSVTQVTLKPGTWRRILGYARPYRSLIWVFLVILVIDAGLTVAQPLLFKRIIDQGITPGNSAVVTTTASAPCTLAAAWPTHTRIPRLPRRCSVLLSISQNSPV